jgi:hypothetical protein
MVLSEEIELMADTAPVDVLLVMDVAGVSVFAAA